MIVSFLNTDYAVNMIYGATYGVVYAFFSKKVNTQRSRKTSVTRSLRELVRIRRSTVFMVLCTLFSSKK